MKVFTNKEYINKLYWLVNKVPNVYYSGKNWSKLNSSGKWQFDCITSIKSILWGFSANKKKTRGGTIYKNHDVADFTCNGGLNYCSEVSKNFKIIIPGEYLCMKGTKYNHSGIYLGDGKVFECTTGWGTKKCIISNINSNGERFYKGKRNLKWTYHGRLKYLNYLKNEDKKELVMELQRKLNEQWKCGLEIDGSFGPLTTKACSLHNLKKGINAPIMVKWLQERLINLGYSVGKYGIDGSFGPDTLKAVKLFQRNNNLKIDGIVGKSTYKKLVS